MRISDWSSDVCSSDLEAGDGAHDVGGLVHHDHGGRAQARAERAQTVEVHRRVPDLVGRDQRHRGPARGYRPPVVTPATDATAVLLDPFADGGAERKSDV